MIYRQTDSSRRKKCFKMNLAAVIFPCAKANAATAAAVNDDGHAWLLLIKQHFPLTGTLFKTSEGSINQRFAGCIITCGLI